MKRSNKGIAVVATILALFATVHCAAADTYEEETETLDRVERITPAVSVNETPVVEESKIYLFDVPLDLDLQLHIIEVCSDYYIEPAVIMAMIERESSFRVKVVGDNGDAVGLMQIQGKWHRERMDKLGVTDLSDPYQNVRVGIDYLAELCREYECIGMPLVAYNYGPSGAEKNLFSKGIYETKYSRTILERTEYYLEGMSEYVCA